MKTVSFDFTSLEEHTCDLPARALVIEILFRESQLATWTPLSDIEKNDYTITEHSYEEIRLFEQEHSDAPRGSFFCSFMKDAQ